MLIGPSYYVIYARQDTVLSTRTKIRCYLRAPRYALLGYAEMSGENRCRLGG